MGIETYDKFDDVDGRSIGTKSRDAKIETASKELLRFFLALRWEIWVHASSTMHRYSPTPHIFLSLLFSLFSTLSLFVCVCDCDERRGWLVFL